MNRGIRTFFAIALGVGIGALLAHQFNFYFWWLGPILGGCVSYLVVDWHRVVEAVPQAFAKAVAHRRSREYKWNRLKRRVQLRTLPVYFIKVFIGFCTYTLPIAFWVSDGYRFTIAPLIATAVMSTLLTSLVVSLDYGKPDGDYQTHLTSPLVLRKNSRRFLVFNSATVAVLAVYFSVTATIKGVGLLRANWHIIRSGVATFFVTMYRLIHTDLRVVCFAHALIFGAITFATGGNLLLWMSVGGAFGVFDDKVICQQWLKILPAER